MKSNHPAMIDRSSAKYLNRFYLPDESHNLVKPWHQVQCTLEQLSQSFSRGVRMPLASLSAVYDLFKSILGGTHCFSSVSIESLYHSGIYPIGPSYGSIVNYSRDQNFRSRSTRFCQIVAHIPLRYPLHTPPWQSGSSNSQCSHFDGEWFRYLPRLSHHDKEFNVSF